MCYEHANQSQSKLNEDPRRLGGRAWFETGADFGVGVLLFEIESWAGTALKK